MRVVTIFVIYALAAEMTPKEEPLVAEIKPKKEHLAAEMTPKKEPIANLFLQIDGNGQIKGDLQLLNVQKEVHVLNGSSLDTHNRFGLKFETSYAIDQLIPLPRLSLRKICWHLSVRLPKDLIAISSAPLEREVDERPNYLQVFQPFCTNHLQSWGLAIMNREAPITEGRLQVWHEELKEAAVFTYRELQQVERLQVFYGPVSGDFLGLISIDRHYCGAVALKTQRDRQIRKLIYKQHLRVKEEWLSDALSNLLAYSPSDPDWEPDATLKMLEAERLVAIMPPVSESEEEADDWEVLSIEEDEPDQDEQAPPAETIVVLPPAKLRGYRELLPVIRDQRPKLIEALSQPTNWSSLLQVFGHATAKAFASQDYSLEQFMSLSPAAQLSVLHALFAEYWRGKMPLKLLQQQLQGARLSESPTVWLYLSSQLSRLLEREGAKEMIAHVIDIQVRRLGVDELAGNNPQDLQIRPMVILLAARLGNQKIIKACQRKFYQWLNSEKDYGEEESGLEVAIELVGKLIKGADKPLNYEVLGVYAGGAVLAAALLAEGGFLDGRVLLEAWQETKEFDHRHALLMAITWNPSAMTLNSFLELGVEPWMWPVLVENPGNHEILLDYWLEQKTPIPLAVLVRMGELLNGDQREHFLKVIPAKLNLAGILQD